jgi:peroxiredoxin
LFDDGRLVGATTRGNVRDPFRLFPRLPGDSGAIERGWDSQGPEEANVHLRYQVVAKPEPESSTLVFAMASECPEDKIYLTTHSTRSTFDHRRGLVTRVETQDTSGYGITGITRGTIELVSVEDRGVRWAEQFGREADASFDVVEAYEEATRRAGRDTERCKALLAEAKTRLETVRADLSTPVFRESIDQRLAQHDRMVASCADEAACRAHRLGKPAADWEAKDLDDKTHRLADYCGKVVVLDFWYRGCGWCMHAMPQVKQLADTFRDQPVAVLGMTIDDDVKDARVVVEAMGLHYPVIQAEGLPEKYGVNVYPTLIVIDPKGKIREIHVGYSPRLFEELSDLVRSLLAEKTAGR